MPELKQQLKEVVEAIVRQAFERQECTAQDCQQLDEQLAPILDAIFKQVEYQKIIEQFMAEQGVTIDSPEAQRIASWCALQVFYHVYFAFEQAYRQAIKSLSDQYKAELRFATERLLFHMHTNYIQLQQKSCGL